MTQGCPRGHVRQVTGRHKPVNGICEQNVSFGLVTFDVARNHVGISAIDFAQLFLQQDSFMILKPLKLIRIKTGGM